MDDVVFIVTAVICAIFTAITDFKDTTETCPWRDFDKRLKMLELVEKRYLENINQLSFAVTESNEFQMHINVDAKIRQVCIQDSTITQITIYDCKGRAHILEAEADYSNHYCRFVIEPSLLFQKIEFFCKNEVLNNVTPFNFYYNRSNDYGNECGNECSGRNFTAQLYRGQHVIFNVSEMSVEYNYICEHFFNTEY